MKRLLFICTGNSCRSPMAEALFKAMMPDGWREKVLVSSAGTAAMDGLPASTLALEVLQEKRIDLSAHRTRKLSRAMIENADCIVVMEERHRSVVEMIAPDAGAPVIVLGELDDGRDYPDIDDPIGGDRSVYEKTREELSGLIERLISYCADIVGLAE